MEEIHLKSEQIENYLLILEDFKQVLEDMKVNYRQVFDGEIYLTDKELSERLKLGRRTLQAYRNNGTLPFIHLGGKVLYKQSDIITILENNYSPAFK